MATVWSPSRVLAPTDTISQLQFGPEDLLVVVSWDGSVQVANLSGDWSAKWQTSRPQFGVSWSLEHAKLYFGGAECRISLVDCEAEQQCDLVETQSEVTALANSRSLLAAGTLDGAVLFDHRVGYSTYSGTIPGCASVDLDIEPDGSYLVMADVEGFCRLWDSRMLKIPVTSRRPFASGTSALSVRLNADSGVYAVSNNESHVAIENRRRPDDYFVFKSNRVIPDTGSPRLYPIYGLDFCGEAITTAGGDKSIQVWDLQQRNLTRRVSFSMACMSVSYSRTGRYCAVGLSNDEWFNTPAKCRTSSHAKVVISELS